MRSTAVLLWPGTKRHYHSYAQLEGRGSFRLSEGSKGAPKPVSFTNKRIELFFNPQSHKYLSHSCPFYLILFIALPYPETTVKVGMLPIARSSARPLARGLAAASSPALFAARPKFTLVTAFARPKSTMADQTIVYTKEAPFREYNFK